MSLNADIMLLFENETGLKSIYKSDGKTYHTLKYVDWLEDRLQKHLVANDSASHNKAMFQFPHTCDDCLFRHKCKNRSGVDNAYGGLECTRIWNDYRRKQ